MHKLYAAVSYYRFSRNIQKDFKLALAFIALLTFYRFFLVFYFRSMLMPHLGLESYAAALINGFRYDAMVAGYFALIPALLSMLSLFAGIDRFKSHLNMAFLWLFALLAAILLLCHFFFYLEFRQNFDHFIFGLVYDDNTAVLKSVWRQYPVGRGLLLDTITVLFFLWVMRPFIRKPFFGHVSPKRRRPPVNFLLGLAWILLFFVMMRGSLGARPVQLKDQDVTADINLNSLVANPFMALVHAVEGHFKMREAGAVEAFLPNGTIAAAAHRFFGDAAGQDLDAMSVRYARGAAAPPNHIFLIVMESMDAWDLLDRYRDFDLLPNMKALGQEGILLRNFISGSDGTMSSLSTIVTGLPDAGVVTNYQPSSQKPYATSIAPIFKQLGYKTRLFYGGYLSWQRIQQFCQAQGFDEIYGGGSMGQWRAREWGVDDDVLFDFVKNEIHSGERTFDVILSTSYHSPYSIDLGKWGFPYKSFPGSLPAQARNASVPVEVFGHLWYADKVLGNFIRTVQHEHPESVFAVSGDHRSHNYIDISSASLYERMAVPLLLYGMGLRLSPDACRDIAGSHMDIAPTLIELAAPRGFQYHALGRDLLDSARTQQGIGRKLMMTTDGIVDMQGQLSPLPIETAPAGHPPIGGEGGRLAQRLRDCYAIGWWRIMKGSALPRPSDQRIKASTTDTRSGKRTTAQASE